MSSKTVGIVVAGSGGSGAMTAGSVLLRGAALAGYYGQMSRLSGPQVRGGEAAALLRFALEPVEAQPDRFDVFCGIDWGNVDRFAAEIPLGPESILLFDPRKGEIPSALTASKARTVSVSLAEMAGSVRGGRANMVAAGYLAALLKLALDPMAQAVRDQLSGKGDIAIAASENAFRVGYEKGASSGRDYGLGVPAHPSQRWLLSGNQAAALGSLRGGIRFVAGYPITPATELVEWLSPALSRLGGQLQQAEDELASINMALGASFGGTPAMTVTSGPGLSLMAESIGLAVAAEVPLVVLDVMRAGPSTGIPTKTEQSDLNLAVHGSHGDAPRVVLSPVSVADNLETTQWAVELAERLQVPAIVLSDQAIG
ncbi:MAG TPA: 2-oxoacid:acceptor oxidoreductase family protein, partial [bacterium]